jgi:hypothetical protein
MSLKPNKFYVCVSFGKPYGDRMAICSKYKLTPEQAKIWKLDYQQNHEAKPEFPRYSWESPYVYTGHRSEKSFPARFIWEKEEPFGI